MVEGLDVRRVVPEGLEVFGKSTWKVHALPYWKVRQGYLLKCLDRRTKTRNSRWLMLVF